VRKDLASLHQRVKYQFTDGATKVRLGLTKGKAHPKSK
jgi:hypothetical protein